MKNSHFIIIKTARLNKSKKVNTITIDTKNLNGEFVPAKGTLKIYKLQAPESVLRPRPWSAPDYNGFSKEGFKKRYPHESYSSEDNSSNWEKEKLVLEEKFDTKKSKTLDLKNIKKL